MDERRRVILLPVRRRLAVLACAYLAGVYLAQIAAFPAVWIGFLCAFSAVLGLFRLRRRKSALFCAALVLFLLGNGVTASVLAVRDAPSRSKAAIAGEIDAVQRENRVWLKNVVCDGETYSHRVLVTLMTEDGETAPVEVGQRVQGTGRLFAPNEPRNPGGSNGRIRALAQNYELSGYLLPGWTAEGSGRFSLREWFRCAQKKLMRLAETVFGGQAPLFQAVLLGSRENLDDDLVTAMRLTGIVHLLTVSGMHLSLIALMLEKLLGRLPFGRWTRFALQTVSLCFYTGLTGAAAGTVRALIMATLRGLAKCRGRRYEPLTALAAAAWIMALIRPTWPLDAAFQFSFFVLLGILLLGGACSSWLNRRIPWMRRHPHAAEGLAISFSAQLAALPIQLLFYGYVPLLALLVNGFAGGLMALLMLGGMGCMALGACLPTVGRLFGTAVGTAAGAAQNLILAVAGLNIKICRLPAPYGWALVVAIAAMMLCSSRIRFGRGRKRALAAALGVLLVSYLPRLTPDARYVQLDVGQGDAAVLRHGRQATLVDVGPASSYDVLRYLRHEGLYVDTLILSHLDEDHAGALGTLLTSEIEVGRIIIPSGVQARDASLTVQEALRLANEKRISIETASAGAKIDSGDFTFDVLSPRKELEGDNERSLVLYTQSMGAKILMTGDLPITSEMEAPPDCDILKVAHHGSKYATSDEFLQKTTPEIALISVGANNRYGHPTERVLEALDSVDATVYRTDESGCITLWLSERGITAQTYLDAPSSNALPAAYTP